MFRAFKYEKAEVNSAEANFIYDVLNALAITFLQGRCSRPLLQHFINTRLSWIFNFLISIKGDIKRQLFDEDFRHPEELHHEQQLFQEDRQLGPDDRQLIRDPNFGNQVYILNSIFFKQFKYL